MKTKTISKTLGSWGISDVINIIVLGSLMCFAANAIAEETTKPDSGQNVESTQSNDESSDGKQLEKFQVTGSYIKRVDIEGYSPVLSISREEIEKSGASTLSDFLRYHPLENGTAYNENISQGQSTSPGGSPLSLRGLGVDATLVLINGRRVAPYAFAHGGSESFVDLNSIPLGAIDRIEILKDGASALYGSDAIAGVVNVILRKDFEGTEATLGFGRSGIYHDAEEQLLTAVTGKSLNNGNVTFTFDYYKRGDVGRGDRPFSQSADHSDEEGGSGIPSQASVPAYIVGLVSGLDLQGTGVGDDVYDFNPDITMVPKVERFSGTLHYNREINNDLEFFTNFSLYQNTTEAQFTYVNFNHLNYWDFGAGIGQNVVGPILDTHPNNPYGEPVLAFWRMTEMGLRDPTTETTGMRLATGLNGTSASWDWDADVFYDLSESEFTENNNVNVDAMSTALTNGTLNPFGNAPNPQSVLDEIRARQKRDGESRIYGVNAKGTSELVEMDAGPVMLAVGAGYRNESLKDEFDDLTAQGKIVGKGGTQTDDDRDINAVFAEVNVPLADTLELQVAARAEDYSDFGSTVNPKVALRYQPNSKVLLRTSWGTGFRAPTLNQVNGSFTGATTVVDTERCNAALTALGPAGGLFCIPGSYVTNVSGNRDLDPEESEAIYLGGVFEPVKDLAIAIDYWAYKREDLIYQDTQFVLDNPSLFPGSVDRGPALFPGDPGVLLTINDTYRNREEQKMDGVDLEIRYSANMAESGKLLINALFTKMLGFEVKTFSDEDFEDRLGSYTYPEFRNTITVGWLSADFYVGLTRNYVSEYDAYDDDYNVDSFTSYDLQVSYVGNKSTKLTFGIENLSNEEPPFAPGEEEGFDPAIHNPIGRFAYMRINHKF